MAAAALPTAISATRPCCGERKVRGMTRAAETESIAVSNSLRSIARSAHDADPPRQPMWWSNSIRCERAAPLPKPERLPRTSREPSHDLGNAVLHSMQLQWISQDNLWRNWSDQEIDQRPHPHRHRFRILEQGEEAHVLGAPARKHLDQTAFDQVMLAQERR